MKGRDLPSYILRRKRDGVLLFRKRVGGRIMEVRLETQFPEGEPIPFALHQERERLLRDPAPIAPGQDVAFVIQKYVASEKYRRLAPRTQEDYDKRLQVFRKTIGHLPPKGIQRRHVIAWQEAWAEKSPHEANYRLRVLRLLMERAIDYGLLTDGANPCKGVEELRYDKREREPWPEAKVGAFRKEFDYGTRERTIFELCLGSGQRIGDVLRMQWRHIEDGGIWVTQGKTKKRLWVPLTTHLRAALEAWPKTDLRILRLSYRQASHAMLEARKAIGAEAFDVHGLRYTAAVELLLAGCDDETIAAVTGQSEEMVRHYTRHVRQRARAKKAGEART
jgi:integrase